MRTNEVIAGLLAVKELEIKLHKERYSQLAKMYNQLLEEYNVLMYQYNREIADKEEHPISGFKNKRK